MDKYMQAFYALPDHLRPHAAVELAEALQRLRILMMYRAHHALRTYGPHSEILRQVDADIAKLTDKLTEVSAYI